LPVALDLIQSMLPSYRPFCQPLKIEPAKKALLPVRAVEYTRAHSMCGSSAPRQV
jgi:hypothetical protein